ncbi:EmrB/QacA subfamily drug resistance transporter [Murinocardiopsis flavida]|uniref:EmrB/QacA subfamily drug resistance transporter n=2 Tax=Murinocardiopsis flavida TaxID=645275 RepID=A0A2P8CZW7_9ACTN|nr:DHA2 family efflux MFS transporter permease subunit [Murinocardiopsis flavida]PSK90511.1 EmrB/QacA subfamily drug resistance transporter [Murinocardiopsis flavida]
MSVQTPDRPAGHRRRWAVLGVLVICLLVVVLDNTILNVALRVISDPEIGLGASQSELAWAINSYTLVFAGLLFTWGVIGDRMGRKRVLMFGLVVFGLGSFASAYAQDPAQLIAARAVMGLGGAAVMPQTLSIITNVFEPEQRARAIGIWAGAVGLALGIGPPLGGLLLAHFWWGSVFLINVPIVVVALALMLWLVPESRNERPGRLDPLGVLMSIVGLVLLVYGIITAGERGSLADPEVYLSIAAGAAVLAVFVWHESRIEHPALNVRLFRNPQLSVAVLAIMLMFFALAGVIFFINFYWQSVREFSPLQAGLLVIPVAVAQVVFAPISSSLVARFGPRLVCASGLALASLALGSYALIDRTTPVWLIEVAFFAQGTGMAVAMTPTTVAIMNAVPREQAGAASAVQNTARQVATALGVAVLGALVSAFYRSGIGPALDGLDGVPAPVRSAAGESIEGTMALARSLGAPGAALVEPAKSAFLSGMHMAALCSMGIGLFGMLVVLVWMPGRRARGGPAAPGPEVAAGGATRQSGAGSRTATARD